MEEKPLGGWRCAAAWAAEGGVGLAAGLSRLAALWLWGVSARGMMGDVSPRWAAAAGSLVLTGWLYSAMRLGRFSWYAALADAPAGGWPGATAFFAGGRRLIAAIGWRLGLWVRRLLAVLVAALPPLLLLQMGLRVCPEDGLRIWWLGGAGLVCLLAGGLAALWLCRYAAAPVFLLEGCGGHEALRRSARLMRRHWRAYLNFLGEWAGALLPCLLVVPIVWLLPRFRLGRAALLLRWRRETETGVAITGTIRYNRGKRGSHEPLKG